MIGIYAGWGPTEKQLSNRWTCGVCGTRYDDEADAESCGVADSEGGTWVPTLGDRLLVWALLLLPAILLLSVMSR